MSAIVENRSGARRVGRSEQAGLVWIVLALGALVPVTQLLQGAFPIFTVVWLVVPLVALVRSRDASRIGLCAVPRREFMVVTALNLGALLLLAALVEPWSHTYRMLVQMALSSAPPDTTFAWLVRYDGLAAWGGMFLYSGLVTLFGEELFFRGWLLQFLRRRMRKPFAIVLQAAFFTLPQLIAALFLPPLQGVLYAVIYSWLAIGVIGGWAASRTSSIFPSLISATLLNLIFTAISLR